MSRNPRSFPRTVDIVWKLACCKGGTCSCWICDYTWWRHQMETYYALLAICAGNSPVNSPHKGQWRGASMFSLICACINGWLNNHEAGDLRRHREYKYCVLDIYSTIMEKNLKNNSQLSKCSVWKEFNGAQRSVLSQVTNPGTSPTPWYLPTTITRAPTTAPLELSKCCALMFHSINTSTQYLKDCKSILLLTALLLLVFSMGLLPDTKNCGLRMRWECRKRFPRHRLQRKPLVGDPAMHHGTCVSQVPWCMSGPLIHGGGENVPGIPFSPAFRRMRKPQFYLSGKRPMAQRSTVGPIHHTAGLAIALVCCMECA